MSKRQPNECFEDGPDISGMPTVIDFAYEIIALHKANNYLMEKVAHLEELNEIHTKSMRRADSHQKEMVGMVLGAALDPESHINKATAALMEKELAEEACQ
jgi:hypothetical protein